MAEAADRDLWVVSSDEDDEEIRQVFGAREKTPMPNSDDSESDWSQPKTSRPLQEAPLPKETLPPSDRRGTGPPAASLDGIKSGRTDPEIYFYTALGAMGGVCDVVVKRFRSTNRSPRQGTKEEAGSRGSILQF